MLRDVLKGLFSCSYNVTAIVATDLLLLVVGLCHDRKVKTTFAVYLRIRLIHWYPMMYKVSSIHTFVICQAILLVVFARFS